jgi:hypothetical protein
MVIFRLHVTRKLLSFHQSARVDLVLVEDADADRAVYHLEHVAGFVAGVCSVGDMRTRIAIVGTKPQQFRQCLGKLRAFLNQYRRDLSLMGRG